MIEINICKGIYLQSNIYRFNEEAKTAKSLPYATGLSFAESTFRLVRPISTWVILKHARNIICILQDKKIL
jgi:hypothetical protein